VNPEQQPVSRSDVTWPAAGSEPPPPSTPASELLARWDRIQSGFVDDPAGALIAAEQLANQVLAEARDCLERECAEIGHASHVHGASTEELRQCMKRYHTLVDRLLSMIC
jgi:hypothetical protein